MFIFNFDLSDLFILSQTLLRAEPLAEARYAIDFEESILAKLWLSLALDHIVLFVAISALLAAELLLKEINCHFLRAQFETLPT